MDTKLKESPVEFKFDFNDDDDEQGERAVTETLTLLKKGDTPRKETKVKKEEEEEVDPVELARKFMCGAVNEMQSSLDEEWFLFDNKFIVDVDTHLEDCVTAMNNVVKEWETRKREAMELQNEYNEFCERTEVVSTTFNAYLSSDRLVEEAKRFERMGISLEEFKEGEQELFRAFLSSVENVKNTVNVMKSRKPWLEDLASVREVIERLERHIKQNDGEDGTEETLQERSMVEDKRNKATKRNYDQLEPEPVEDCSVQQDEDSGHDEEEEEELEEEALAPKQDEVSEKKKKKKRTRSGEDEKESVRGKELILRERKNRPKGYYNEENFVSKDAQSKKRKKREVPEDGKKRRTDNDKMRGVRLLGKPDEKMVQPLKISYLRDGGDTCPGAEAVRFEFISQDWIKHWQQILWMRVEKPSDEERELIRNSIGISHWSTDANRLHFFGKNCDAEVNVGQEVVIPFDEIYLLEADSGSRDQSKCALCQNTVAGGRTTTGMHGELVSFLDFKEGEETNKCMTHICHLRCVVFLKALQQNKGSEFTQDLCAGCAKHDHSKKYEGWKTLMNGRAIHSMSTSCSSVPRRSFMLKNATKSDLFTKKNKKVEGDE